MDHSSVPHQGSPWDVYTDRAALYAQHRLDYAPQLVAEVAERVGLKHEHAVADMGAGPGKLAQHLLDRVGRVYCVEPNAAMLAEAQARFGSHPSFVGVPRRAEATGLEDDSVHLITAGMSLDWFDPPRAFQEFQRITHPSGWLAIFRYQIDRSFLQRLASSLEGVSMPPEVVKPGTNDPAAYLAPGYITLQCHCSCDESWERFVGGTLSTASAPAADSPEYHDFCPAHRRAFLALSVDGKVRLDFTCTAAVGRLRRS